MAAPSDPSPTPDRDGPDSEVQIRFDSLAPGDESRSVRFGDLRRVIVAREPGDVLRGLGEVEEAVAKGFHAAGYVGFEAAPAMDPALPGGPGIRGFPMLWFGIFGERLEGAALEELPDDIGSYRVGTLEPSVSIEEYQQRTTEILSLIAAGDTYQVNLTFRVRGSFEGSQLALYKDMCRAQRSAFCAYLPLGDVTIVSASPELFFHRTGDRIRLRPMKGTRPRGRWPDEDDGFARTLAESQKDRAENLMIVDLLRNDLGRVAEFGSVEVVKLFEVESYPTVHQMTSTIEGRIRPTTTLVELFRALFPSGSVTGAPKIRTCEIIQEMESSPRGPYTGAIGFVSPGEAVFSVAIRTALLDSRAGTLEMGVGSGITADSQPAAEYEECLSKGAFLRFSAPDFHLIEALRLEVPGGYLRREGHLDRAESSARYFAFPFDREAARGALDKLAGTLPPGIYKVRLLVSSSGELTIGQERIPEICPPARVRLAREPVDEWDPFLFHKTTHRVEYEKALAACPGCDDVILFNRRGELTETTTGNLVLEIDGRLVTPPVECGLLAGVFRRELLRADEVHEALLHPDELNRATRILVINSVRGWREAILS